MTVRQLSKEITSYELSMWMAYFEIKRERQRQERAKRGERS